MIENRSNQLPVFEPFYITRSKNGGSGLGLAMVKSFLVDKIKH